jgi:hypothetical protein
VTIDESRDLGDNSFVFTTSGSQGVIDGEGVAPIFYNPPDIASINIVGNLGTESFLFESTLGGFPIGILGEGTSDSFVVGFATGTLDNIHNPLSLSGGDGVNTLLVADQNAATGHFYTNNGSTITRNDGVTINYEFMSSVQLNESTQPIQFIPDPGFPAATNLALTSSIRAGQSATLTGQLTDVNPTQVLSLTVNWGDGSPVQQSTPDRAPFSVSHEYEAPGTYTVLVTWSDQLGQHNERKMTITVQPDGHHRHHDGHEDSDHDGHEPAGGLSAVG